MLTFNSFVSTTIQNHRRYMSSLKDGDCIMSVHEDCHYYPQKNKKCRKARRDTNSLNITTDDASAAFMFTDGDNANMEQYLDSENSFPPYETNRSSSFINSWAHISYGVGASFNRHLQGTVRSLIDIPSYDRRSSGFLMGVNLQSMILGTSLLSIPFCSKVAGIWSLVLIFIIGILTNFTASILSECQYQESYSTPRYEKRIHASFVDMSKACWRKAGGNVMKVLVYLSLARNVIVIILLTDIASEILAEFKIFNYDKKVLAVVWTLATLPLLFITKVSALAWVSFIGLVLYLNAILAVLVMCCLTFNEWDLRNMSMHFDIKGVGIASGIIINSYAVHMNLPSLEASLQKPDVYKRTTNITFVCNIIVKVAFAICGYLSYLKTTQQEITSNIDRYHPLPTILRAAIMFFAYFTIPLQSFVVFELIDETFKPHFPCCSNNNILWLSISRMLFMTMCLLIAIIVPQFGLVVSLIGSIRGSMIALVLPALFYVMLPTHEITLFKKIVCYFIIVFGIVAGAIGVYASAFALIYGV